MRRILAAALLAAPAAWADGGCPGVSVIEAAPHPSYAGVSMVRVESRAERIVTFRLARGDRASPPLTIRPRESGAYLARLGPGAASPRVVDCHAG